MTLDQLQVFIAVAETLSMTRAAERLHLTQPSVSAAIAVLEERHATQLFHRVGRRLELSEAGKLFLPAAREVLAQADIASRVLDDLAGLARGSVRIAASQTVATYWLPRRMARFAAHYPHIRLTLAVGNSAQTAALVMAGDADIGFVEARVEEDLLAQRVVGGDRIGLYAAAGHPLAGHAIAVADLQRANWVLREPGSGTRDHAMAGLAQTGIATGSLRVSLELPSNAAAPRVNAGTIRRLDWELPERAFTMLAHRARRPGKATAAFTASL